MMSFRTAVAAAALLLAACQMSETNSAGPAKNQQAAEIAPILDTPEAKDTAQLRPAA